ncbi:MAG: PHP domain-containing protein [Halioglobus sp.]
MLIDFHTHTTASDGALTPSELLARARTRGVQLFAITDHDTVAGFREVAEHYTQIDDTMVLIPGIEMSCQWSGATIHVVGLGMDCDHPAMEEALTLLNTARKERGEKIGQRLEKLGFTGALEGAMAEAGSSQLGRPHFAAWMVAQGHVESFAKAFDKYLGRGKTGDVKAFWPQLSEVVQWIVSSGGSAVLAHPLKYRFTRMKLRRLANDFHEHGGSALEVHSGFQTPDQRAQLQRLAEDFNLAASVGSDFHRDSTYGADVGVDISRMGDAGGIWERFSSVEVSTQ